MTTAARPVEASPISVAQTPNEACASDDQYGNEFTLRFGVPAERPRAKIKGYLAEDVKAFIRQAPFVVMATADAEGRCDASPNGGRQGFVTILDDQHLLVPDVAGHKLFQGYRNMADYPHVGLLFMIP